MIVNDTDAILQVLKDQREETRQDMHELRGAVVKIADAAADMGKTMARSEQRHSSNEESVKRLVRSVDDHETRLRSAEIKQRSGQSSNAGGWKVLTVIGALVLGIVAVGSNLYALIQ